ncbi:unnamed protein product [Parnassius apollo]|uniref:(apollo) hypothetical protein n=1 Tax=Parnassius apollo TaxID=110799 RepID=A0A8S3X236_PARAO|nr:unnamed protein product [Parnassius apollo]
MECKTKVRTDKKFSDFNSVAICAESCEQRFVNAPAYPYRLFTGHVLLRLTRQTTRHRHVCIFFPPKEDAGARLYTHYYVLPTFNYYYQAAPHPRRGGEERRSCCLPIIKTCLWEKETEMLAVKVK